MQTLDLVRLLGAGLSFLFAVARFAELVWDVLSDQRKAELLNRLGDGVSSVARRIGGLQLALIVVAARLWQRAERLMGRDLNVYEVVVNWQRHFSVTTPPPPPPDEAAPPRPPTSKRRKDP